MSANSFGHLFKITSFGESHGPALGVVIEGCPAGIKFNHELLKRNLEKRKPGQKNTSSRQESDVPELLSGVFNDITLGTPIAIIIKNINAKSDDYTQIKNTPRVGHADDVWKTKYSHTDHRGGGRSSGRETVSRVIGGSVAQMIIKEIFPSFEINCYASQIGPLKLHFPQTDEQAQDLDQLLLRAQNEGQSFGGTVNIKMHGLPIGLGQPVFKKFKADLAGGLLSIGATCALEVGEGIEDAKLSGTQLHTEKMNYGGIRGGITTGEDVFLKLHFKPTSSILDVAKKGRHDPCIILRALPVVEAMCSIVVADHLLWKSLDNINSIKKAYLKNEASI